MEEAFRNDLYSRNINMLQFLGLWASDTRNLNKKRLFFLFRCLVFLYSTTSLVPPIIQLYLYLSEKEFRKISFNLSTTLLSVGIFIKNVHVGYYSEEINKLRWALYQDAYHQNDPKDEEIKQKVKKRFIIVRKIFYYFGSTFLVAWLSSSLLTVVWGPRELPFSVWLPINLDNDKEYAVAFAIHVVRGCFVVAESIHAELSMFSLLSQIEVQYKILAKNIGSLNNTYSNFFKHLKFKKYKKILLETEFRRFLRQYVKRQLQLDDYVNKLEYFYCKPMLLQLAVGLSLAVFTGVEFLGELGRVNIKWFYEIGYTIMIAYDIFLVCSMASKIFNQREELALAIYSIDWYDMEYVTQKNLILPIMSAQTKKSFTAWKIFQLDLQTFLGVLRTVGSWLTLFWQFMKK